jgi:hypothetical protein
LHCGATVWQFAKLVFLPEQNLGKRNFGKFAGEISGKNETLKIVKVQKVSISTVVCHY